MYYRYDVDKLEMYKEILTDPHATELYHDFLSSIVNCHGTDIDFIYSKFDKYMCYALDGSLSKKYSPLNKMFPVDAWYDKECKEGKALLHGLYKRKELNCIVSNNIEIQASQK